jgi:hypothetical protein
MLFVLMAVIGLVNVLIALGALVRGHKEDARFEDDKLKYRS